MLVVVIGGDSAGGRGVLLGGIVLRGVTVVCGGEDHGRLVCLRVLMVQVDHAPTAIWCRRYTAEGEEKEE